MKKFKRKNNPNLDPIESKQLNTKEGHGPWQDLSFNEKAKGYDASVDPYCLYTQTSKFREHMRKRMNLEDEERSNPKPVVSMSRSVNFSNSPNFDIGMKPLDRPSSAPDIEKFPKNKTTIISAKTGGLTYSTESFEEGQAELEVLKAILNREGYLGRLEKTAKKIGRKFKPEIADILDFIRAASIDVVEAIVKWREAKNDHDAAFMWNGVNYLLKMPSDLDYLAAYKTVRDWLGFSVKRNPFCVPFPMDEGQLIFTATVTAPKHIDDRPVSDGFVIGNISLKKLKTKYNYSSETSSELQSPYLLDRNISTVSKLSSRNLLSENSSRNLQESSSNNKLLTPSPYSMSIGQDRTSNQTQSFIFNNDMNKLRLAEQVILKEESKFGRFRRAPDGRIVSVTQAHNEELELELRKDEFKPLSEKSATTAKFAPHALMAGIGLEEERAFPEEKQQQQTDNQEFEDEDGNDRDPNLPGRIRGKNKVGGQLTAVSPQAVDSKPRSPIKTTAAGSLDFNRHRKKQTIGQRLAEITELRDRVRAERLALQKSYETAAASGGRSLGTGGVGMGVGIGTTGVTGGGKVGSKQGEQGSRKGSAVVAGKGRKSSTSSKKSTTETDEGVDVGIEESLHNLDLSLQTSLGQFSTISTATETQTDVVTLDPNIESEQMKLQQDLGRIQRDDDKLAKLKDLQREEVNALRAREIERKRRLLEPNQMKIKGAIIEDSQNVYDFYAIRVQAVVRGWLARVWMRWYRQAAIHAAIMIQSYARGYLARMRVKNKISFARASTLIQCAFRCFRAKKRMDRDLGQQALDRAATKIQKIWRGVLGVRRALSKRLLDNAGDAAIQAVDPKSFFPLDAKELARRIQLAMLEPETTSFPPDEVLQLIRIVVMILEAGKEDLGLTYLSHINNRKRRRIVGEEVTWEEAMMYVNRSNRFVRIVRAFAFAPIAKPPRLIKVPAETRSLYEALRGHNPKWNVDTFQMIGDGAKCCVQLFKWVVSMMEVSALQEQFLSFIANQFGDWLNTLIEQQKASRRLEFDATVLEKKISILEEQRQHKTGDSALAVSLTNEIELLHHELDILKENSIQSHNMEEQICTNQSGIENYCLITMKDRVKQMETDVIAFANDFTKQVKLANEGNIRAEQELPALRAELIMKRVELQELRVNLKILEAQCGTNRMIRLEKGRLPVDNRLQAIAIGEAQALLDIVQLKKKIIKDRAMGITKPATLDRDPTQQQSGEGEGKKKGPKLKLDETQSMVYSRLKIEEEHHKSTLNSLRKKADSALERYHLNYSNDIYRKQKSSDAEKFMATEEELEEDRIEDEKEAKLERLKRRQYVPDSVLNEEIQRPRPLLIAYCRDIPSYLKTKIHTEVTVAFPGLFIQLDSSENMGLDLKLLQDVLDAKKSIILSVDHGLTKITRDSFLKNFEMVIKALVPRPVVIFVMGDEGNMKPPTGEQYYGVSLTDLACMRDSSIKQSLESMATILHQLVQKRIWHMMEDMATALTLPTVAYVTVLEALYIVQADHDDFRIPDYHIAAVSWKTTHVLLKDPLALVKRLMAVPRGKATERIILSLTEYLKHRHWPAVGNEERTSDPLLNLLASYVELWTKAEEETMNRGGLPEKAFFKNSVDFLQTVVTVSDLVDPEDTLVANKRGGWQVPVAQIVRSCLQDMRVMKVVQKIEGMMYTINVYRDGNVIYFDTYESSSSQVYITSVKVPAVPDLLTPNTFAITHGLNVQSPQTSIEMYKRLTKLLRFEKTTKQKGGRKQLVCRRDYTLLTRLIKKIDGHTLMINSFEAALGEIYFDAYIPEFSSRITLLVDDETRLKMQSNYDVDIEKYILDCDQADVLLPFFIDRLRVSPSRSLLAARGRQTQPGKAVLAKFHHQGFHLKVRSHGGAGSKLGKLCTLFAGVPHILTIRSCGQSKTLRVVAYQPATQHSMDLRITATQRQILLGSAEDDIVNWKTQLLKRLRIVWRGTHKLDLNLNLIKAVKRIAGRMKIMSVNLENENAIRVNIFDPRLCTNHSSMLTKDDVIRLLKYSIGSSSSNNQSNEEDSSSLDSSVKSILKQMVTATGQGTEEGKQRNNQSLDVSTLNISMYEIFKEKVNAITLMNQLEALLERVESSSSGTISYVCRNPIGLKFSLEKPDENVPPLSTELRKKGKSLKKVSDGSVEGVTAARRQPPVIEMETELNLLAERREEEARALSQNLLEAANALETTLNEATAHRIISVATSNIANEIIDEIERRHSKPLPGEGPGETDGDGDRLQDDEGVDVSFGRFDGVEVNSEQLVSDDELDSVISSDMISVQAADGSGVMNVRMKDVTPAQREILVKAEKVIFERGVKVNFRDGVAIWHGHVKVKVLESACWGGREGVLRRLRFVIFEPGTASYYENVIKNNKHLREVLGLHAQDLVHATKTVEMLLFICSNRVELVRNVISRDGEPVDEGEPYYRLEFLRDRLYMVDKVTPVHLAGDGDALANRLKLINNENTRGRKILRMARRVSGVLMHLQVFEIPKDGFGIIDRRDEDEKTVPEPGDNDHEPLFDGTIKRVHAKMERHECPILRIVGYDPKSRQKSAVLLDPKAVGEIAGGVYSPYLEIPRRRELARLICESLVMIYPRGKAFDLFLPWSGASKDDTSSSNSDRSMFRSSADKINKRPGRLFRSGVVISHMDLIVTVFLSNWNKNDNSMASRRKLDKDNSKPSSPKHQIIINFYSPSASESFEITLDEREQASRVGRSIPEFPVGVARATAVRNLCRFCRARIEEDPENRNQKMLKVELIPAKKDFLNDYKHVVHPSPGDDTTRPVGAPVVFLPLDTKGELLLRKGLVIPIVGRNGDSTGKGKEYVVSIYTKSVTEGPERGLVVSLYDRTVARTLSIHIGPSEIIRLCNQAHEPDILHEMVAAVFILKQNHVDVLEADFETVTDRAVLVERSRVLVDHVVDIVLKDIGVRFDALGQEFPCLRTSVPLPT